MSWLALDIGGANLKAADGMGYAKSTPFELWKTPDELTDQLAAIIATAPKSERLAVTMTGELADCYQTKSAGVQAILDAVELAAGERHLRVYLTDGRLVSPAMARQEPLLAAASNWHALAAFANRFVNTWPAVLLDMGSTTTDVIALSKNGPAAMGKTDLERLVTGELVYSGVERTPICALVRALPLRGQDWPVAAELFATTGDAYLLLGQLAEREEDSQTADGRPFRRTAAHARLARMFCADTDSVSLAETQAAAVAVREAQLDQLVAALRLVACRMNGDPLTIIISGQGEYLLRLAVERLAWQSKLLSLSTLLGASVSHCAPAHALAVLAHEHEDRSGQC